MMSGIPEWPTNFANECKTCMTPDAKTEIGYRLGLCCSALLSKDFNSAETLILMNLGYDVRSLIVLQGLPVETIFKINSVRRQLRKLAEIRDGAGCTPICSASVFSIKVFEIW